MGRFLLFMLLLAVANVHASMVMKLDTDYVEVSSFDLITIGVTVSDGSTLAGQPLTVAAFCRETYNPSGNAFMIDNFDEMFPLGVSVSVSPFTDALGRGVITITSNGAAPGDYRFCISCNNDASATGDFQVIPEPLTLALLLLGVSFCRKRC
jgi:hypothetical protein